MTQMFTSQTELTRLPQLVEASEDVRGSANGCSFTSVFLSELSLLMDLEWDLGLNFISSFGAGVIPGLDSGADVRGAR